MNTIAGQDVGAYVRLMLDDSDATDYELTEAQLNTLLANAVRDYSAYVPYVLESTFATVVNQAMYKLATDVLNVLTVEYRTDDDSVDTLPDYLPELEWWGDEAAAWVRHRLLQNYRKVGEGRWAQITGLTSYTSGIFIYLYPSPDSVETVRYRYSALHPLVGTDYPTVSPHHVMHLRDWVIALGRLTQAAKWDSEPTDYNAGQTRFRMEAKGQYARRMARGELARIQQAITPNLSRMA